MPLFPKVAYSQTFHTPLLPQSIGVCVVIEYCRICGYNKYIKYGGDNKPMEKDILDAFEPNIMETETKRRKGAVRKIKGRAYRRAGCGCRKILCFHIRHHGNMRASGLQTGNAGYGGHLIWKIKGAILCLPYTGLYQVYILKSEGGESHVKKGNT